MSKDGRYENRKPKKGKWIGLTITGVILMSVLGIVAFASTYMNNMFDKVNHVEVAKVEYSEATEEVIELQETEDNLSAPEEVAAESEEVYSKEDFQNFLIVCTPVWENTEGWLTDTMILCTLNTRARTVTMTSVLKDTYVQTPAYKGTDAKWMKLNAVYGMGATYGNGKSGSMEYINQTMYDNFGIEIDHNFEISMELFARVVKRLGDVSIDLSEEEAAYLSEATKTEILPGVQQMDGSLALSYVKMWNEEESSGISSLNSQRKMIEAIVEKVRTKYIADLEIIVKDMLPMITTSMTHTELRNFTISLLPLIRDLSIEKGGSCPAVFEKQIITTEQNKEQEVLTFDVAQTTKAMRALTLGEK